MPPKSLEESILSYKRIYSITALVLGFVAMISGYWLSSQGYSLEVTGWMLNIFGCRILYNDNNLAPGISLFLVGIALIIITQYRIRSRLKPKGQDILDSQTLFRKFVAAMLGLTLGYLSTIFGIVLAENGGNLCPADWAERLTSLENLYYVGVLFVLGGITILVATRYRIRTYDGLGEDTITEIHN